MMSDEEANKKLLYEQLVTALYASAYRPIQANDPSVDSVTRAKETQRRSQAMMFAKSYLSAVSVNPLECEALAPVPAPPPLLQLHALTPRQATEHSRHRNLYLAYRTRKFRTELEKYDKDIAGRNEAKIKFGEEVLQSLMGPKWAEALQQHLSSQGTPSSIYSDTTSASSHGGLSFCAQHTCPHGVPLGPGMPVKPTSPSHAPVIKAPTTAAVAQGKGPAVKTNAQRSSAASKKDVEEDCASVKRNVEEERAETTKDSDRRMSDSDPEDEDVYHTELEKLIVWEAMQRALRGESGDLVDNDDLSSGYYDGYDDDLYGLYGEPDDYYGDDFRGYGFDETDAESMFDALYAKSWGDSSYFDGPYRSSHFKKATKKNVGKSKSKGGAGKLQQRTLGESFSGVGPSKAAAAMGSKKTGSQKSKRKAKGKGKATASGVGTERGCGEEKASSSNNTVIAEHGACQASGTQARAESGPAPAESVKVETVAASSQGENGSSKAAPESASVATLMSPRGKLSRSGSGKGSALGGVASVGLGLAHSLDAIGKRLWKPTTQASSTPPSMPASRAATSSALEMSSSATSDLKLTAKPSSASAAPTATTSTKRRRAETGSNSTSGSSDKLKPPAKTAKKLPAATGPKQHKEIKYEIVVYKKRYLASKRPFRDSWYAPIYT